MRSDQETGSNVTRVWVLEMADRFEEVGYQHSRPKSLP